MKGFSGTRFSLWGLILQSCHKCRAPETAVIYGRQINIPNLKRVLLKSRE
jgi:hypothetical protein